MNALGQISSKKRCFHGWHRKKDAVNFGVPFILNLVSARQFILVSIFGVLPFLGKAQVRRDHFHAYFVYASQVLGIPESDTCADSLSHPPTILDLSCPFNAGYRQSTSIESVKLPRWDSIVSSLYIRNCTFRPAAHFGNEEGLSHHPLNKGAIFLKDTFNTNPVFQDARFGSFVQFDSSLFRTSVDFTGSQFDFFQCTRTYFNDTVFISYCRFSKPGHFCDDVFQGPVSFAYDTFENPMYFRNTHWGSRVLFRGCCIRDAGWLDFTDTWLPDTLDFSYCVHLNSPIDLSYAHYDDDHRVRINLYKADFSKLKLDYRYFKLIFFDPENREHSVLSPDEQETIYEGMLKNFKDRGQLESYRTLDIEYHQFKWEHSFFWWLVWIPHYWWDFGYDKDRVILWTLSFLLIFTAINYWKLPSLNRRVYPLEGCIRLSRFPPFSMAGGDFGTHFSIPQ
jgi:hypothetical protein